MRTTTPTTAAATLLTLGTWTVMTTPSLVVLGEADDRRLRDPRPGCQVPPAALRATQACVETGASRTPIELLPGREDEAQGRGGGLWPGRNLCRVSSKTTRGGHHVRHTTPGVPPDGGHLQRPLRAEERQHRD